jgi:hypothetical protein
VFFLQLAIRLPSAESAGAVSSEKSRIRAGLLGRHQPRL